MPRIHWLGAGLSSVPGIRRLAAQGRPLTLWNRTLAKAHAALDGVNTVATAATLDWTMLRDALRPGDVVVSMLPASLHLRVAELCLEKSAHFVSSSYVSDGMRSLQSQASDANLCFLNEVGLDPGLDHLMAHALVHAYRSSDCFDTGNQHYFRSYCGGLPKDSTPFRYKFSWSPLGVLQALTNRSQWLEQGKVQHSDRVWESISDYPFLGPEGRSESFEAYPNRDSLPYVHSYGMRDDWDVQQFVRGTLRPSGWAHAWQEIFELVDRSDATNRQQQLEEKSAELWERHQYQPGEADRVVLAVELEVHRDGASCWHQDWSIDAYGNECGSAMARLVSWTTSLGIESVLHGQIQPGVTAAVKQLELVESWFAELKRMGESIQHTVRV